MLGLLNLPHLSKDKLEVGVRYALVEFPMDPSGDLFIEDVTLSEIDGDNYYFVWCNGMDWESLSGEDYGRDWFCRNTT